MPIENIDFEAVRIGALNPRLVPERRRVNIEPISFLANRIRISRLNLQLMAGGLGMGIIMVLGFVGVIEYINSDNNTTIETPLIGATQSPSPLIIIQLTATLTPSRNENVLPTAFPTRELFERSVVGSPTLVPRVNLPEGLPTYEPRNPRQVDVPSPRIVVPSVLPSPMPR